MPVLVELNYYTQATGFDGEVTYFGACCFHTKLRSSHRGTPKITEILAHQTGVSTTY
jgi:hypothetical protein